MLLANEREIVCEYGRRLVDTGLVQGTSGNISCVGYSNSGERLIAITPTGLDYYKLNPSDIVVVNHEGQIIDGDTKPTSELQLHLTMYRNRVQIGAVVHTHSVYATTLACLGWEIPAVHYLVGFSGKKVPLAPYATFGTDELAEKAHLAMGDHNAVLLANHGLLAVGNNLPTAFTAAQELEFVARIYFQTKAVGSPVILPDDEMDRVIEKFKSYGQKK